MKLPKVKKAELERKVELTEEAGEKEGEKSNVAWIILFAFTILLVFGAIVWLIFSGRVDQRIDAENFNSATQAIEER